jgi:hypothetical protein
MHGSKSHFPDKLLERMPRGSSTSCGVRRRPRSHALLWGGTGCALAEDDIFVMRGGRELTRLERISSILSRNFTAMVFVHSIAFGAARLLNSPSRRG